LEHEANDHRTGRKRMMKLDHSWPPPRWRDGKARCDRKSSDAGGGDERVAERAGRSEAIARLFGERHGDDVVHETRHVRAVGADERRIVEERRVELRAPFLAMEGMRAGERDEESDPCRPDVDAVIDVRMLEEPFGREVVDGAE